MEVYELYRLDFADAYLVASAERTGIGVIASFDRSIHPVSTVRQAEPRRASPQHGSSLSALMVGPFGQARIPIDVSA